MSFVASFLRTRWTEYVVFGVVTIVGGLFAWAAANEGVTFNAPPAEHYNRYGCETARHSPNNTTLKVLDLFRLNTNEFAERLCDNAVVSQHYDNVQVIWMHRDQLDLREIINQSYDLILVKPELFMRLTDAHTAGYVRLASYQEYSSELIATQATPALTNDFFRGKRLGLMDDPNSLSGYQIPKAALQKAHIDKSIYTTVYFKSHADLHRALAMGDVDVIASYSADYFGNARGRAKQLDLQRGLSGVQWLMHPKLANSDVHCEVHRDLIRHPSSLGLPSSTVRPIGLECRDAY